MPQFDTIEDAFSWFLENVFPELPTETKIKLKDVKYDFKSKRHNFSQKRMTRILNEYGTFKTHYSFEKDEN